MEEIKDLHDIPLLKQKSKSQDTKFLGKSLEQNDTPNHKKPVKASRKMTDLDHVKIEKHVKSVEENQLNNSIKLGKDSKLTFQEKIKLYKISAYADSNKRKKNMKFIRILPEKPQVLTFKFKHRAEYVKTGQKIFIKDDTMNAFGIIKEVFYCNN